MSSAVIHQPVSPVSATSLATERLLAVDPHLAPLFRQPGSEQAGLVRGQVIRCTGVAPLSLALAASGAAIRSGAWLAVVDVPALGVEAAAELGVPLERLVSVETGAAGTWPEVMGAVADGFEIILASIPKGVPAVTARKLRQRIRARGTVLLAVPGPSGVTGTALPGDIELRAGHPEWHGLDVGHGHLHARRLVVEASGRRLAPPRSVELLLPGPSGRICAAVGDGNVANVANVANDTVIPLLDAS